MNTNSELLTRIDDAMAKLRSGRTCAAQESLRGLRRFVCEIVVESAHGYTCSGCSTYHAITTPPEAHHGGVHHTCTKCGQVSELWRDVNLGEVRPMSKDGKALIQSVFGGGS